MHATPALALILGLLALAMIGFGLMLFAWPPKHNIRGGGYINGVD